MVSKNNNKRKITGGFLRLPEVLELIPISKSSWLTGVKDGRYPKPSRIGLRTMAWSTHSIEMLVNKLSEGSSN
jgi:predicted DNA-binding transcriptional regulator AlpA